MNQSHVCGPMMIAIIACASSGPVQSDQQAPYSGSAVTLEEIIVTAEKRSQRLADVPMSSTAVARDTLSSHGLETVGDLEKIVPGLIYTQSPYGAPVYTIRGIGFFDEAVGASPAVTVYVDQVPIPFSRATEGATLDVERVEVLKGPQGTFFGQNSTGGAINYIAAKPTRAFTTGAVLSYGRFDEVDAQSFISGPITDKLTARVAFRTERRDGWQQSTSRDADLGQRGFQTGRLLVDWEPADSLRFELNANGWKDTSDTQANQFERYDASALNGYPGSVAYPNLAADLKAEPPAPRNDRAADWDPGRSFQRDDNYYQVSVRGDWDITNRVRLTSISSYSKLRVDSPQDVDGTRFQLLNIAVDAFANTTSQEIRLAGTTGTEHKLHWMIGGNYQHDRVSDVQHVENQGSNSGVGPFRFLKFDNDASRQHIETKAIFGSVDFELIDTLVLQASTRYTEQDRNLHGCLVDRDGGLAAAFGFLSTVINNNPHVPLPGDPSYIPPGGCATLDPVTNLPVKDVYRVLDENNVSWRGGLSWKPTADTLMYWNVTRGYKGGSFGTIPAVRPAQFDPIKQESVTAYEAGAKAALLNRALDLSGAVFRLDYNDKQLLGYISDSFFGSLPGLVSVPRSRVLGAELNLVVRPIRAWTTSIGGTYVESKVLSNFDTLGPLATSGSFNIRGEPFPNTPKWHLVGDTEYRLPITGAWSAYAGSNVIYRSRANSTFAEPTEFQIKAYALVDARIGLERKDGSLGVEFWGRNITDVYYWRHVDHVLDTITRSAGMPATYGFTVSLKL